MVKPFLGHQLPFPFFCAGEEERTNVVRHNARRHRFDILREFLGALPLQGEEPVDFVQKILRRRATELGPHSSSENEETLERGGAGYQDVTR